MTVVELKVQGSAEEPYLVRIVLADGEVTAHCTCTASENGKHCKHRVRVLAGNTEGCVDGDIDRVPSLPALIVGSKLEAAMAAVADAESEADAAKKRVSEAKKRMAIVMRGGS